MWWGGDPGEVQGDAHVHRLGWATAQSMRPVCLEVSGTLGFLDTHSHAAQTGGICISPSLLHHCSWALLKFLRRGNFSSIIGNGSCFQIAILNHPQATTPTATLTLLDADAAS